MNVVSPLWEPSQDRVVNANMTRFMRYVSAHYRKTLTSYNALYEWSVERIPEFWEAAWSFLQIQASRGYDRVVDDVTKMPGARWFVNAELNFAENLLRCNDSRTALIFKGEDRNLERITYEDLHTQVALVAQSLREAGVRRGDRVGGLIPNMIETVVAMLATTSVGAVWSSCSPDFGTKAVLDRFGQIEPKILFTTDGYRYNGRTFDSLGKISAILKHLPATEKVVVIPYIKSKPRIRGFSKVLMWDEFISHQSGPELEFVQVPSDHPLYIMYSSGTTGLPKCMVQGVAGILINHLKELVLHTDLKRDDTIFYYTTCGWMMWNWLVSSLAMGATVLLFDGSPFYPSPYSLWQLAQDEGITIFGTSARYITALEKAEVRTKDKHDLSGLKVILSTGSPLTPENFEYVYRDIKTDVQLASISGGTDLNGCFALGSPIDPVYAGELQCRGLGMKVKAYDEEGRTVVNQKGELVCEAPFPSMPLYFWNDPDNEKYLDAYFRVFPGVWHHGDFVKMTDHGGLIIYGRSDATLNPGGVRIGTADIYRVVDVFPEVEDSLAVGQDWEGDMRVILFVKLAEGKGLSQNLLREIKRAIRENTTPRHVPDKIIKVDDIPYTINMKKVELAVRNVIHGQPVRNRDALVNPESLELYKHLPELER